MRRRICSTEKPMNYRHIYHAGNFADVVKHLLLVLCIDRLHEKDTPFFVLDAMAGRGLYDLNSAEAQKTREYEPGVGALMKKEFQSADAEIYLDAVRGHFKDNQYPGSPVIVAKMLREKDRLVANELHPEEAEILLESLKGRGNAHVTIEDGYQAIRANIPPAERRGIVLIDPAYEIENNEHQTVIKQMQEWKKRWGMGIYILWLPIKDNLPVQEIYDAAIALDIKRTWLCEYREANLPPLPKSDQGNRARMRSAGVIIFNAPFMVPERAAKALAEIAPVMGGHVKTRWLVPDRVGDQGPGAGRNMKTKEKPRDKPRANVHRIKPRRP
jgi:23S rRNA (adenine2030-N6)-methyltransferase